MFSIFCSILFSRVGAPAKKKSAFAKAASIPARRQSENAGPRLFGFFFDAATHLEYFSNFFELSTKAAFAKAAFDTLRILVGFVGDKFGESLGGGQAPPREVPGLPRKFPKLPRKFFSDFPGSSLTVVLNSNAGLPRKFPRLLPRTSPEVYRILSPYRNPLSVVFLVREGPLGKPIQRTFKVTPPPPKNLLRLFLE